ncbi:MAG: hypothetical protein IT285_12670 [Bdellovibrionales bacterium]|nr:hypothetical protein [Bdellovibrionales bacterium]
MRNQIVFPVMAVISVLSTACVVDPDPGVCWTSGEFDKQWVEQNSILRAEVYVHDVCMDWVELLYNNCVEIYDLPFAPTYQQVSDYCTAKVRDNGESMLSYQIDHACNFERNPSTECILFASGSEPGSEGAPSIFPLDAAPELMSEIEKDVVASERLSSTLPMTHVMIDGMEMPFAELLSN